MACMGNSGNPFRPGAGLDPPYLAGREREIEMFGTVLQSNRIGNPKNVLLYGLHGVGKTALLGKFASMCRDMKFLPVVGSMRGPCRSDPAEFAAGLGRAFRASIGPPPGAGEEEGGLRAAARRPEPPAAGTPMRAREAPHDRGMKEPLADRLVDYFLANWEAVKDLGYAGAVLLLDEFHAVGDAGDGQYALGDFLAAVNEAQRQGCGYSLVLSGLPVLTGNVKRGRPYAERMFKLAEVDGLADADARRAVLRPLDATGRIFSPGLVSAVVEDAGGCPYFIQFIAHEILRRFPKARISLRDYKSSRGGIMDGLHGDFFGRRMADLASGEKSTLYSMSMLPEGDMRLSAIVKAAGAGRGTVSARLARLGEKCVVYKHDRGMYRFALPLLRPYLVANRPQSTSGQSRVSSAG